MSQIQSILFDKYFFSVDDVYYWLKLHNIVPLKPIHEVSNFYRVRIKDPRNFYRFITKDRGHIKFIIGFY